MAFGSVFTCDTAILGKERNAHQRGGRMDSRDEKLIGYPITYELAYADGSVWTFELVIDQRTLLLVNFDATCTPGWARLEFKQCTCCPLSEAKHPYCPVAVNIAELIDNFKARMSTDQCRARCITPERMYLKETISVQKALSSILGIVMATSGCPVMAFYKPMAFFHLPFATTMETLFRSASMYLLREYFEYRRGGTPDLEMKDLGKQMEKVGMVNQGILARIRSVAEKDADANAIIILDSFSSFVSLAVEDKLSSLSFLFPPDP